MLIYVAVIGRYVYEVGYIYIVVVCFYLHPKETIDNN